MKKIFSIIALLFVGLLLTACGESAPVPKNLSIENHVLKWDKIDKAEKYIVVVDEDEHEAMTNEYDLTTLELSVGSYEIRVKVVIDGKTSKLSKKTTYVVELILTAPKNVTIEGAIVSWDAVEEASGYIVVVDNDEYEVSTTTFDLASLDLDYGGYDVKVKAVAGAITSEYSNVVTYVYSYEIDDVTKTKLLKENNSTYELNMTEEDFRDEFEYAIYLLTVQYVEDYIETATTNNLPVENVYSLFEALTKVLIGQVDLEDFNAIIAYVDELQALDLSGKLLGEILYSKAIMSSKLDEYRYEDIILSFERSLEEAILYKEEYEEEINFAGFLTMMHDYATNEVENAVIDQLFGSLEREIPHEILYIFNEVRYDINFQYGDPDNLSYVHITEVFKNLVSLDDDEDLSLAIDVTDNLIYLSGLKLQIQHLEEDILHYQESIVQNAILREVFEEEKESIILALEAIYDFLILTKEALNSEQVITIINKILTGEELSIIDVILLKNVMLPVIKNNIPTTETFVLVYQTLFRAVEDFAPVELEMFAEYTEKIAAATTITIQLVLDFLEIVDTEYLTSVQEFIQEDNVFDLVFYTIDYYEEFISTIKERYADLFTEEEIEEIFIQAIDYLISQVDEEEYEALIILEIIKDNYALLSSIIGAHDDKLIPLIRSLKAVYESTEKVMEGLLDEGVNELILAVFNLDELLFGGLTSEDIEPIVDLLGQLLVEVMRIDLQEEFGEEIGHLIDILLSVNEIKSQVLLEASKLDAVEFLEHEGLSTGDDREIQYKTLYFVLTVIDNTLTTEVKEEISTLIDVLFEDVLTNPEILEMLELDSEEVVEMQEDITEFLEDIYGMIEMLMSFDYDNLTEDNWEILESIIDDIFYSPSFD